MFDEFEKKKKKYTKNDMIYGIFNEESGSSSDDNPLEGKARLLNLLNPSKQSVGGFVKSNTLLYNPESKVNVKWLGGEKPATSSSKLEDTLNMIKEFDRERGKKHEGSSTAQESNKNDKITKEKNVDEEDSDGIFSDHEKEELKKEKSERENFLGKRKFDFKKKDLNAEMALHQLPTGFGSKSAQEDEPLKEKKIKLNSAEEFEKIREGQKLKDQYGIGYKLLKLAGFEENKGLGKNKQGRVAPVEAVAKSAFSSDFERRLDGKKKKKETEEQRYSKYDIGDDIFKDIEEKNELRESYGGGEGEREPEGSQIIERRWSKKPSGKRYFQQKSKGSKIKTAKRESDEEDDEENEREGKNSEVLKPVLTHQKIVDMRGPNVMFYDSMDVIGKITKNSVIEEEVQRAPKVTIFGEMLVNIRGALERQKHNLRVSSQRKTLEKDKVITFEYEAKKLQDEINTVVADYYILVKFNDSLKLLEALAQDSALLQKTSSDEIINRYKALYELSAENFLNYDSHFTLIRTLTIKLKPVFNPKSFLSSLLDHYQVFEKLSKFLNMIYEHKLSKIHEGEPSSRTYLSAEGADVTKTRKIRKLIAEGEQAMSLLLENTILTHLRSYLVNEWLPREESTFIIDLLKKFQYVFPPVFLDNIIDNIIITRLNEEVKQWNPTKEKIMIHMWIHPWLEIVEEQKLSPLWKIIQARLAQALQSWMPSDTSAFHLLAPWRNIFDLQTWNNMIARCILPKLMSVADDFEINPEDQNIDVLRWIKPWLDILDDEQIVILLEQGVLNKIAQEVEIWLKNIGKNEFEDLIMWIDGWKKLLGPKALRPENIQNFFRKLDRNVAKALASLG